MRKIYKIPQREHGKAAAVACTVAGLVLMGLVSHSRAPAPTAHALAAAPATSAPAATAMPDAAVYFPSQYELHAGPPEPLPAQF
jgi:hypothetical protein